MKKDLKIGCGEWGFRELPMEDHFRIARSFGFKWMEFGIGGNFRGRLQDDLSHDGVGSFVEMAKDYQIQTPFCCIENDFTLQEEASHRKMVDYVLRQIPILSALGAGYVRLFAGFTPVEQVTDEIWDRMVNAFHICQAECKKHRVKIAIETHGRLTWRDGGAVHTHTVSTHAEYVKRLIRELPPGVGFNYDPGNLKAVNPADKTYLLPLLNDHINYCHLKDWRRLGEGWVACAIGDDDLDYGPLLAQMHYDGVYLIEYEPVEDVEAGIERSLSYLRSNRC